MRRAVCERELREQSEIVVGVDEEGLGTRARSRRGFIGAAIAHHVETRSAAWERSRDALIR